MPSRSPQAPEAEQERITSRPTSVKRGRLSFIVADRIGSWCPFPDELAQTSTGRGGEGPQDFRACERLCRPQLGFQISIEERYGDHRGYVDAVEKAAAELVREGFLLEEDAERFIRSAEASDVLR